MIEILLTVLRIASLIFLTAKPEIDKKIIRISVPENSQGKFQKAKDEKRKKNQDDREKDSPARTGIFGCLVVLFLLNGSVFFTLASHGG